MHVGRRRVCAAGHLYGKLFFFVSSYLSDAVAEYLRTKIKIAETNVFKRFPLQTYYTVRFINERLSMYFGLYVWLFAVRCEYDLC